MFGFLLAYVLLAVYRQTPVVGGFDATDALTFTFVAQGLLMVIGIFGDTLIADRVRTGDVVSDLHRPVDFQGWWAADTYGSAAFHAVFRGIPPFLVGALVFRLRLPPTPAVAVAFIASVAAAVAVGFAWRFLLQMCAFWLLDVRGPNQIGWLIAQFFAGSFIPIVFFPGWLGQLARVLPFAAMLQTPIEVFLGKHRGLSILGAIAGQLAWAAALLAVGRIVLRRALRKLVIQGG